MYTNIIKSKPSHVSCSLSYDDRLLYLRQHCSKFIFPMNSSNRPYRHLNGETISLDYRVFEIFPTSIPDDLQEFAKSGEFATLLGKCIDDTFIAKVIGLESCDVFYELGDDRKVKLYVKINGYFKDII